MTASVLLDTSFLISLVDGTRPNHEIAVLYYRLMLEQQVPMYFSAIAAAEFSIKQPITDLPLKNFRSIPFNITEDASTLHKYCMRLQSAGISRLRAITLADGFDPCAFREDGQRGLSLDEVTPLGG